MVIKINKAAFIAVLTIIVLGVSAFLINAGCNLFFKAMYPIKYEKEVSKACDAYGVEKELVYAIIKCESGFDPCACSHADARGLMQITPDTFSWLKKTYTRDSKLSQGMLKDPETNIMYGTLLISVLKKKYHEDDLILSAYNAGNSVVKKWLADKDVSPDGKTLKNIPYKETREYVQKVKNAKKFYKKLYF